MLIRIREALKFELSFKETTREQLLLRALHLNKIEEVFLTSDCV